MERYDPKPIEAKWQRVWEDERTFHTPTEAGPDVKRHYLSLIHI